jgi:hypothetical protein
VPADWSKKPSRTKQMQLSVKPVGPMGHTQFSTPRAHCRILLSVFTIIHGKVFVFYR